LAQEPPPPVEPEFAPESRLLDPRAEELVRKMSDLLANAKSFALEAEDAYDEVPDDLPRTQLENRRYVALKRPDRLAGDATRDAINRSFWYDRKTLSLRDKEHHAYARVEVPATIDEALDAVFEAAGAVIPLADFLYSDVYVRLKESVQRGVYLRIHNVSEFPCHHLAFEQESIDWQIWIDAGDIPLPRKLAGGALLGTAIGAIASGGEGAAIGAAVGGGAGGAAAAAGQVDPAVIAAQKLESVTVAVPFKVPVMTNVAVR
jgi:hypothetical protein